MNVSRSPFENKNPGSGGVLQPDGGYGIPGWDLLKYNAVQAGGSATYNFLNGTNVISFLYGSPDPFNLITFYALDDVTVLGTLSSTTATGDVMVARLPLSPKPLVMI